MSATQATPAQDAVLLTCSMPADLELFDLLAASVDAHVDPQIRHIVVVPGRAVPQFRPYATARREIVAQEDVLPARLYRLPRALRHLSFLNPSFRRPLYVDRRLNMLRGWMLQQVLKIEMSTQVPEQAIIHCDSDVVFVRPLAPEQIFTGGKTHFFTVHVPLTASGPANGPAWAQSAGTLLDVVPPTDYAALYIENCLIWDTGVARSMADRIHAVTGRSVFEALARMETVSEYVVYGTFVEQGGALDRVAPQPLPLCKTNWNEGPIDASDVQAFAQSMQPYHVATAVQSTSPITLAERKRIYRQIEAEMPALPTARALA